MIKKKMIFATAAIIAVMLLFGACPEPKPDPGPKLESISVTPPSGTVGIDKSITLTASPVPDTVALGEIEWVSNDTFVSLEVLTANSVRVTGVAVTETPINVTARSKANTSISGSSSITVNEEGIPATGITVNPSTLNLVTGGTSTLAAVVTPQDSDDTIEWESSNSTIVSVNSATGVITAVAVGTATITASSKENPEVSGTCVVTVSAPVENGELKMTFIPGEGGSPVPTLEGPDSNNIYKADGTLTDGNFATADGFRDVILIYPDIVLSGDFKFRVRVQVTDNGPTPTSSSRGIVVGAFRGNLEAEVGDFSFGAHNTVTTGINLRNNGFVRNFQSRPSEAMAAVAWNTLITNKNEEFIYEVIRTEEGIKTAIYISKNGEPVLGFEERLLSYAETGNPPSLPYIQADTPVYVGVALGQVAATISQVQLWEGDLDGEPVFYTGDSPAAPVSIVNIALEVTGDDDKGSPITGAGTRAAPADYFIKLNDVQSLADNSFKLEIVPSPAYADIITGTFGLSEIPDHPNDNNVLTISDAGIVKVTGLGQATVYVLSDDDDVGASFYLTITIIPDYTPVEDFNIIGDVDSILVNQQTTFNTDISPFVSDPVVVWTSNSTAVMFLDGEDEVNSYTGPSARIIGKDAATSVTITATATTTNGGVDTVKSATKIITVQGTSGARIEWNFSEAPFRTIADNATFNEGAEIAGSGLYVIGAGTMTYNAHGNFTASHGYTHRLNTGGNGSLTDGIPTNRALKFDVNDACTITVFAITGSNGNARPVVLHDGTAVVAEGATNASNAAAC